jgi:hypothetical protein
MKAFSAIVFTVKKFNFRIYFVLATEVVDLLQTGRPGIACPEADYRPR